MKKISAFLFILFFASCGYQPIFLNNNPKNFEFQKINFAGDNDINKKIINKIKINENNLSQNKNKLFLSNNYSLKETSKNSKGVIQTYKSTLLVNIKITNDGKIIKEKNISKNFNYNKKDNKSELIRYQNQIKNILIDQIINDVILFLNSQ